MPTYVHRHRVRYREADPMGIVYHSHCLDWFEAARTEALRNLGVVYRELEENGVIMPVVELAVRYHRAVRYDDCLEIATSWPDEPATTRVRFDYAVRRTDEPQVLISAHVTLCFVDRDTGRPVRAPRMVTDALADAVRPQ